MSPYMRRAISNFSVTIPTAFPAVWLPFKLGHKPGVTPAFHRSFADHTRCPQAEGTTSPRVSSGRTSECTGSEPRDSKSPAECKKKPTVAERDAEIMERWRERQGSLANAQLEDGQVESGYRRNVKANIFRYI